MRKRVAIDQRARKEIKKFPGAVKAKIQAAINILNRDGRLQEPLGKKVDESLYEIRVKHQGQWRVLYAYLGKEVIVILSAFMKKTQRMPREEKQKAISRLKEYANYE